jgi:hypothetical protein
VQRFGAAYDGEGVPPTTIILARTITRDPSHAGLAEGMRGVWASALHAWGADVFAPNEVLDPDLDPFAAVGGQRGVCKTHDDGPPTGHIAAVVLTQLEYDGRGWRLPVQILEFDRPSEVFPGRLHRGRAAVLGAMDTTLRTIAAALDLDLPRRVDWRVLLCARTIAQGLDELRTAGQRHLGRNVPRPAGLLH